MLIIEGIHCLNDKLSAIPFRQESKFKIYISALTQLNVDEHNRIPTTDGRLHPPDGAGCQDQGDLGSGDHPPLVVGAPGRG